MVVAVGGGPDEEIGAVGRGAHDQIGIARVMREEVEPHHPVGARGDAAVLHVVGARGKVLVVNGEGAHDRDKIHTHMFTSNGVVGKKWRVPTPLHSSPFGSLPAGAWYMRFACVVVLPGSIRVLSHHDRKQE